MGTITTKGGADGSISTRNPILNGKKSFFPFFFARLFLSLERQKRLYGSILVLCAPLKDTIDFPLSVVNSLLRPGYEAHLFLLLHPPIPSMVVYWKGREYGATSIRMEPYVRTNKREREREKDPFQARVHYDAERVKGIIKKRNRRRRRRKTPPCRLLSVRLFSLRGSPSIRKTSSSLLGGC